MKHFNFSEEFKQHLESLSKVYDDANEKNGITSDWSQKFLYELDDLDKRTEDIYRQEIIDELKRLYPSRAKPLAMNNTGIIIHSGFGEVYPHNDDISKSVFLIPVYCSDSQIFIENKDRVKDRRLNLQPNKVILFNDYNQHSLDNPNYDFFMIISVSKEQLYAAYNTKTKLNDTECI